MSKEQEERHNRIIRELLKQPANKKCFDCPTKGPVYVNLFNDTFICAKCSGIHREFNHRVKSIIASTFTPAEVESLKNGGNAKAIEIWLAKYKWVDFPEPDPSDIESIRTLMSMKYQQKKWLDESLLKAKNKRSPNGEDCVAKGTFVINSPALNNKSNNNSSSNLTDDSSSQHSSLNDRSPVSPTSRKSDSMLSNASYLKYSSDTCNGVVSPSSTTNNIPTLPKPNSNNLNSLLSGPNNNHTCDNNVKNELDDFFGTLNDSSNQQQSITKRNNTYLESNKISTATNAFFTQQNLSDNCSATYSDQNISRVNSNPNIFSTGSSLLDSDDFNPSPVNYNNPFGHVRHSSLTSIASSSILKPKPASPSSILTMSPIFDNNNNNNNKKITNDPFIDLLSPTKSETSKRFPPQKSDDDDDIFSDFQTAPDVNSQKTMRSTNLNSHKNHTYSNGFTNTNVNSSQQKQFGHSKSIPFNGLFSDLDPLTTTSSIFGNNNKITSDPFINLLPLIKSETSKRFPPRKSDGDNIFSDFQAAPDINSQKTMRSTNLNSYKNHTFSNGFTNTNTNSLQQKQFGHSKSISFDSTFSDLDPLYNK